MGLVIYERTPNQVVFQISLGGFIFTYRQHLVFSPVERARSVGVTVRVRLAIGRREIESVGVKTLYVTL